MDIIAKLNQTCVYWSPLFPDGYGGYSHFAPSETNTGTGTATADVSAEELACRWDEKMETVLSPQGEEVLSRAQVSLAGAVEEGGYLFYGIAEEAPVDPSLGNNAAYKIIQVVKTPSIDAEDSIWVAYL